MSNNNINPNQQDPNLNQNQTNSTAPSNPASTQNSLEIAEIREGMVIMRDGSFRAVVACKSINFDLMSAREREGVEYSYQSFLNALTFLHELIPKLFDLFSKFVHFVLRIIFRKILLLNPLSCLSRQLDNMESQ